MSEAEILKKLKTSIVELDIDSVKAASQAVVETGVPPARILGEISEAMTNVGLKYEKGDYFLADLLMAAETMKEALEVLNPHLKSEKVEALGKVVMGTVLGDIHDLGKNIVVTLLTSAGFEVHDLGIDVPPEEFVKRIKEINADILGMSALLPITMEGMKDVIDALKKAGIRDQVKVIIGGAPLTEEFARSIGADAYAKDAVQGVEICKKWVETA